MVAVPLKISGRFTKLLATDEVVNEYPVCSLCGNNFEPDAVIVEDLETGAMLHYRHCRRLAYMYYMALHPLDSDRTIQIQFGITRRELIRLKSIMKEVQNGQ